MSRLEPHMTPDSLAILRARVRAAFEAVRSRADKFWSFVDKGEPGRCWEWQRTRTARGYGVFYVSKIVKVAAHRAAYMLASGKPIEDGKIVCHSCDNPPCCNPAHLWLGTDADNNADRHKKGRTVMPPRETVPCAKGAAHGSAKLTDEAIRAIRSDPRSSRQIGQEYGVGFSTVARIKKGVLWGHVV